MALVRLAVFTLLLLAAVNSLPASQRYMWMSDDDGKLHLIDLFEEESEDLPVPYFTGEKDVTLNLYTQNNPTSPEVILISNASSYPSFNPKHPTRFVIHGWISNGKRMDAFREAYIETGLDFNVVIVDWKGLAASEYSLSKTSSRKVGEWVAQVITHLVETKELSLDDVYIIGHSLGAQASGVAGNRLNGEVAQIVGLDAAAPLFGLTSSKNRLDPSDAKQVQGIHTNGGLLGWKDPLGHVDFFPGGGSDQAGCILDLTGTCSHNKAPPFYAESIVKQEFVATLCHTYKAYKKGSCSHNPKLVMGEWTPLGSSGNYYLKTNSKSPYGLGDIGL